MLTNDDIKNIKRIINQEVKGGFFEKRKKQKQIKDLVKYIDEFKEAEIKYYNSKLRQAIKSIKRQTRNLDNDIIKDTANEETFD